MKPKNLKAGMTLRVLSPGVEEMDGERVLHCQGMITVRNNKNDDLLQCDHLAAKQGCLIQSRSLFSDK